MIKDKDLIKLTLRAFKFENIDEKFATDTILERYSNSKRFNWNNFQWGFLLGFTLTYILLEYVL